MSKKHKHEEHEEHVNHEAWVIPYADMLTLLMGLFLVMWSMGQMDMAKMKLVGQGFAELVQHVEHQYLSALVHEPSHDRGPGSSCPTGHDRHPTLESSHRNPPPLRARSWSNRSISLPRLAP